MWELFRPVDPRRVDLSIQPSGDFIVQCEESQKRANVRSDMLEGTASVTAAGIDNELLDLVLCKIGQLKGGIQIPLEIQQLPDSMLVCLNGALRQSSHLSKVSDVICHRYVKYRSCPRMGNHHDLACLEKTPQTGDGMGYVTGAASKVLRTSMQAL